MKECREAEDIPDLQGDHIVSSYKQGSESVFFYVPEGAHTLIVSMAWNPIDPTKAEDKRLAGKQVWKAPLLPSSGYHLSFGTAASGLRWSLSSNNPAFVAQSAEPPLRGNGNPLGAPVFQLRLPDSTFKIPLMVVTNRGLRGEDEYYVDVDVRLLSN